MDTALTEASVSFILLSLLSFLATAADAFEEDVDVAENNEGGGQDWPVMEGHDQLVALELPHLVGYGLHLKEGVAVKRRRMRLTGHFNTPFLGSPEKLIAVEPVYLTITNIM